MALRPTAIIASWMNDAGTRAFSLQADGVLVQTVRDSRSDVWSPPITIGTPMQIVPTLQQALLDLTTD